MQSGRVQLEAQTGASKLFLKHGSPKNGEVLRPQIDLDPRVSDVRARPSIASDDCRWKPGVGLCAFSDGKVLRGDVDRNRPLVLLMLA
jgi:hypothetical protein